MKCSILVLSCDHNQGLLNIFFDRFKKFWPDCEYTVYLGTEKIEYQYPDIICLNSDSKFWSRRLKSYLKRIETEYVLIILDDFILESIVDSDEINKYLLIIYNDKSIANLALTEIYDRNNIKSKYEHLCTRNPRSNYLLNLQVGFWNKRILFHLLKDNESPWETELFGSIRARKFNSYQFMCLRSDENQPYKYNRGWLMVRGKWNGNEIKRLHLERYADDFLDGKDIIYSDLMKISFHKRVIRRLKITVHKCLSYLKIYI